MESGRTTFADCNPTSVSSYHGPCPPLSGSLLPFPESSRSCSVPVCRRRRLYAQVHPQHQNPPDYTYGTVHYRFKIKPALSLHRKTTPLNTGRPFYLSPRASPSFNNAITLTSKPHSGFLSASTQIRGAGTALPFQPAPKYLQPPACPQTIYSILPIRAYRTYSIPDPSLPT